MVQHGPASAMRPINDSVSVAAVVEEEGRTTGVGGTGAMQGAGQQMDLRLLVFVHAQFVKR